jgi:hypothetical protein
MCTRTTPSSAAQGAMPASGQIRRKRLRQTWHAARDGQWATRDRSVHDCGKLTTLGRAPCRCIDHERGDGQVGPPIVGRLDQLGAMTATLRLPTGPVVDIPSRPARQCAAAHADKFAGLAQPRLPVAQPHLSPTLSEHHELFSRGITVEMKPRREVPPIVRGFARRRCVVCESGAACGSEGSLPHSDAVGELPERNGTRSWSGWSTVSSSCRDGGSARTRDRPR